MNFYCRCLARCFESSSKRSVEDLYIFFTVILEAEGR